MGRKALIAVAVAWLAALVRKHWGGRRQRGNETTNRMGRSA
jgi:hypothetical protein